ncbi:ATP-binding protein [Pedobacter sp. AW1-32]|uniref:PAS domain-containing sensor histidine kinase n=1 Tax=Pedobacter sp. AW1-32 TaxID=3383026 RepID=UPI003FF0D836
MPEKYNTVLFDSDTLYENAPCGYCSFLSDGQILRINQTFADWLGFSNPAEVKYNYNFKHFLTKAGKIYYEIMFSPMIQMQDSAKQLSFDICRLDGSQFPVLINASAMRSEKGELIVNTVIIDISDRKKYEKELLAAKNHAETQSRKVAFLSDFSPELIWSADRLGTIDQVNKRFVEYFNIKEEKPDSQHILSHIHPEDKIAAMRAWLVAVSTGDKLDLQLRLRNKLYTYHWFAVRAEPFKDLNGKVDHWLGSCSNIDSHMLVLEKRDEFLNIAGHELKTPITSLKGALQLMDRMKSNISSPVLLKLIEQSNQNVEKIIRLFNELLISGKQDDGVLPLQKSLFSLDEMLENCCVHVRLDGKHQLLHTGETGVEIYADKSRIEQIVVNFVNNAVKYAPDSMVITLDVRTTNTHVQVSISDSGPGIEKAKQQHLFERYYRASANTDTTGLGLGLYICADIISRHNGEIGVDSEPGKGSTFWFGLPKMQEVTS